MPADLYRPDIFSEILYEKMKCINPGVGDLELYEFRYGLDNLYPGNGGWASIKLDEPAEIEKQIRSRDFYASIQVRPSIDNRIVLDGKIVYLTHMLFVGLVTGKYTEKWVKEYFYFDIRGFYFLTRTVYFTAKVLAHLGGKPFKQFEQRQKHLEKQQAVGYREFKAANEEVDQAFIDSLKQLIKLKGTPLLVAIAGATAAGKTEITERLKHALREEGKHVTSIEMDNFFTDRDYREENDIHSLGQQAIHFELFKQSLEDIGQGKKITIPRYDFIYATSSHDLNGNLKPDGIPIEIEPADIVFIEGNFPFLLPEVVPLIGLKIVYLTDDPVRMKRKWKRDIDYRKKYEPTYFRNQFFRSQFLMAQTCFGPQLEVCDIVVDTTGAALWTSPEIAALLSS